MEKLEIGIATLAYNQKGENTAAGFEATMALNFDNKLLQQLGDIKCNNDPQLLKENADLVLGGFFAKLTEIELRDSYKYEVSGEVIKCTKWADNKIKECQIKYSFREVPLNVESV